PAFPFTGQQNSDIAGGEIKPGAAPAQLYNLEVDLYQSENLYYEHPEKAKELEELLHRVTRQVDYSRPYNRNN
ncbi:MAG TPA: hypothetical protein VFM60_00405, partial [Salinimicrobium sp.]|nr:hypothetical protein [Salinimicrobium sp.]